MQKSTNFELNVPEGSDKFAPLSNFNPNWTKIDSQMKLNEDNSIPTATEAVAGTVHNIIRNKPDASMFRFTATGDVKDGDTFTVDGVSVQAVLPNGQGVTAGSYLVNSQVLACVVGSQLTIYTSAASGGAVDAATLEGHPADYFATATQVENATTIATAARTVADNAKSTADEALQAAQSAGFNIVEVWRNDSPGTSRGDFTITVTNEEAAQKAKLLLISTLYTADSQAMGNKTYTLINPFEGETTAMIMSVTYSDPYNYVRSFGLISRTKYSFTDATASGSSSNRNCIPYKIWAIY